jgi:hypothetical protein
MEILNQNQRNRAFWRIFVLFLTITALIAWITYFLNFQIEKNVTGNVKRLMIELEREKAFRDGEIKKRENENNKLKQEISQLKKQQENPDEKVKILEERLKQRDDEIQTLERENARLARELNRY